MAYYLTSNTEPTISKSNVVVGVNHPSISGFSLQLDYTDILNTIASHLNDIRVAADTANTHLAQISYRHRLIHSNIALLAFRGSRHDYGIVTRMSNTDCWIDMCPYDASLLLMGLEEGNTMAYYNEILIENGLTPIFGRKIFENAGFEAGPASRRLPTGNVFVDRVEEIPPPLDLFNLPAIIPAKPNPEID